MPVQHVGRPLKRVEDPKLITGSDPYVNDVRLANALTMAVVRSSHAHAEITRLDTAAAARVPGVVAVVTGKDVNAEIGVIHCPLPDQAFDIVNREGHVILAEGRVRHVGWPVAVVVAKTAAAAAEGTLRGEAHVHPLPPLFEDG